MRRSVLLLILVGIGLLSLLILTQLDDGSSEPDFSDACVYFFGDGPREDDLYCFNLMGTRIPRPTDDETLGE